MARNTAGFARRCQIKLTSRSKRSSKRIRIRHKAFICGISAMMLFDIPSAILIFCNNNQFCSVNTTFFNILLIKTLCIYFKQNALRFFHNGQNGNNNKAFIMVHENEKPPGVNDIDWLSKINDENTICFHKRIIIEKLLHFDSIMLSRMHTRNILCLDVLFSKSVFMRYGKLEI